MRTFIAIELDKEIKQSLSIAQEQLKKTEADVKWVKHENLHLTIKFLGEVDEKKISKINECLKEIAQKTDAFDIQIDHFGLFPDSKFPRVIWAGTELGKDNLKKLSDLTEDAFVKLKFPKEKKKFSAHFTLGRFRSLKNKDALLEELNKIKLVSLKQKCKSIILFKSTLTSGSPIYEKLKEENFRNN